MTGVVISLFSFLSVLSFCNTVLYLFISWSHYDKFIEESAYPKLGSPENYSI